MVIDSSFLRLGGLLILVVECSVIVVLSEHMSREF
jgi:hypothetical protein